MDGVPVTTTLLSVWCKCPEDIVGMGESYVAGGLIAATATGVTKGNCDVA